MARVLNIVISVVALSISLTGALPYSTPVDENCTKAGFCMTKPEGYDEHQSLIDKNIRDLNLHLMEDRYGPESDVYYGGDDNNCRYVTKTIKPYVLKTDAGDMLIVQSNILNQTIVETNCVRDNGHDENTAPKQCFLEANQSELTTICQETAMTIELHVFNIKRKKIEKIFTPVNVWCSCLVGVVYRYK